MLLRGLRLAGDHVAAAKDDGDILQPRLPQPPGQRLLLVKAVRDARFNAAAADALQFAEGLRPRGGDAPEGAKYLELHGYASRGYFTPGSTQSISYSRLAASCEVLPLMS